MARRDRKTDRKSVGRISTVMRWGKEMLATLAGPCVQGPAPTPVLEAGALGRVHPTPHAIRFQYRIHPLSSRTLSDPRPT